MIRQRPELLRAEPLFGYLFGGLMHPGIGHVVSPVIELGLHVGQVFKLAQRPEAGAKVFDAIFHFSFFMGGADVAGHRRDMKGPQKIKKCSVKSDQGPHAFSDSSQHIVDHQLGTCAAKKSKRGQKPLM